MSCLSLCCLLLWMPVTAQIRMAEQTKVAFSVAAPAKVITGESGKAVTSLDTKTGVLQLKVGVKTFHFQNNFIADSMNLVVENRFNNYYMESNQFPDIVFQGRITDNETVTWSRNGDYPVQIKGTLSMHGITQEVSASGTISIKNKKASITAGIVVIPTQFRIRIPPYIGNMYFKQVTIKSVAEFR